MGVAAIFKALPHLGLQQLVREEFSQAIKTHQTMFGLELSQGAFNRLADYYDLIREHNELLHLVAPCSPEEFAIRHILESLTLLEHLPQNTNFADVGTGAGLPSIPCLLVRQDLSAVLIESKQKKTAFLQMALEKLGLSKRAKVENHQFEETNPANCEYITVRALDKFTEKLPRLLKWSQQRRLLLFGGKNLRTALQKQKAQFRETLIPMSLQRYLFVTFF